MQWRIESFFNKRKDDAIIFQVAPLFIEVAVIRKDSMHSKRCTAEILFVKRLERVNDNKKTYTDIAQYIEQLTHEIAVDNDLQHKQFSIADAQVVCIFADVLSQQARITYEVRLKHPVKITQKLLARVLRKGKIISDETVAIPKEYAVYAEHLHAIQLNGYDTRNPLDKVASHIAVTVVQYLTLPAVWSATGAVCESLFNRDIYYVYKETPLAFQGDEWCDEIYTGASLRAIEHGIL